jgi:hypothetical protein
MFIINIRLYEGFNVVRLFEIFGKPVTKLKTLYVCRHVKNAQDILDWAKEQGFKNCVPLDQFHTTIAYSKEKVDWDETSPLKNTVRVKGGKRSIEKLGDAITLRFFSDELYDRWEEFVNEVGCSWDFPSYIQHISITFKSEGIDIKKIEPYHGEILFGPEEFSEIKEDFTSTFKELSIKET